jgi:hypothetical protein
LVWFGDSGSVPVKALAPSSRGTSRLLANGSGCEAYRSWMRAW